MDSQAQDLATTQVLDAALISAGLTTADQIAAAGDRVRAYALTSIGSTAWNDPNGLQQALADIQAYVAKKNASAIGGTVAIVIGVGLAAYFFLK